MPRPTTWTPAIWRPPSRRRSPKGRLKPRVVIAVDLFGQPADYPAIKAICDKHGLKLISDSAQGFGCTINGEHPLKWADVTTTSFFPAKPLGCYGDGGAVLTDDDDLAQEIDSCRVHGKAVAKDLVGRDLRARHQISEHAGRHELRASTRSRPPS